jgi:phospholipase C
VFDWLTERGIRWRVYRSGLPFELLIERLWDDVFDPARFRSVKELTIDVNEEDDTTFPQVIFLEPAFADSPINLGFPANDDHPPRPIGPGQQFMREMYLALSSNPRRWRKTVLVVTYDEHGGFYDHVEPARVTTRPPSGAEWTGGPFATTGVRVPAIVASPLARPGTVHGGVLDHTSILQLIASVFGRDGETYSADVDERAEQGIGNISDALGDDPPRDDVPRPPETAPPLPPLGPRPQPQPPREGMQPRKGANAQAFERAALEVLGERSRAEIKARYPELLHWEKTRQ